MTSQLTYSILIPAYESEKYLPDLLAQIKHINPQPREVFVVNDGSSDNTGQVAEKMGAIVVQHECNKGKGAALKTGFQAFLDTSKSAYLLCMDADLQHSVEEIPKFISYAGHNELQFIIGNRLNETHSMPIHRKISNKTTSYILSKLTGQPIKDSQCGYRLLHRDLLSDLDLKENGFQLESEMILKVSDKKLKIDFVDIGTVYNGESSQIRNVFDTFKFVILVFRALIKKVRWFTRKS